MSEINIDEIHQLACENQQSSYKDPLTGFTVLTAFFLKSRGFCCGGNCRHCPYTKEQRAAAIEKRERGKRKFSK
jgi:hypothetical protein